MQIRAQQEERQQLLNNPNRVVINIFIIFHIGYIVYLQFYIKHHS